MRRIGLMGGSFNPAHHGHRGASLAALDRLGLDEVWWLVSPGNPLKPEKGMAPYEARLASARAMARRAPIRVSDFEREAGTRYTVDTLKALKKRHPRKHLIWMMGEDTVAQFHQWKDWRPIARTMPIAVMSRPGYKDEARTARVMGWLRWFVRPPGEAKNWTDWSVPAILFLDLPPDPTSATSIRARNPHWYTRYLAADERS